MTGQVNTYLVFVVFTIALGAFQYGYHIGELNTPQAIISKCKAHDYDPEPDPSTVHNFFPPCIPMSDSTFSLVVSMLNVGGLLGAIIAPRFSDRFGRRLTLFGNTAFLLLGSLSMGLASNLYVLLWGRFLAGVGSGIITVICSTYIAECVPDDLRGIFGVCNQLGIVLGILVAQILGMFLSTLSGWRWILLTGAFLALLQSLMLPFCVESPRYLASKPGGYNEAKASLSKLRGTEYVEEEINSWRRDWAEETAEQQQLLDEIDSQQEEEHADGHSPLVQAAKSQNVGMGTFLTSPFYRKPLAILLLLHVTQQFSGINAVIFYSTSIMTPILPQYSDKITVFISLINVTMTLVSGYLMDRLGRRSLFLYSSGVMAFVTVILAWSMDSNVWPTLSAISIIGFVAAFAVGLGPIPFLMVPEIVDTQAVSTAGSIALSTNWICNFAVSAGFLVVRNALGGGGKVFYVFAVILAIVWFIAYRILPETKGRSVEEVVRSNWAVKPSSVRLPTTSHTA
ncbi:sugar transporter [Umbelopsis sp. PMI_123]|nr:sugar transporter [Umbelopsis sp. PMI_123]